MCVYVYKHSQLYACTKARTKGALNEGCEQTVNWLMKQVLQYMNKIYYTLTWLSCLIIIL